MMELLDVERRGGALTPKPVALLRYNTEAATPGNTTVALRMAIPVVCIMDWGDGSTQTIRPADYTVQDLAPSNEEAGANRFAQTITHTYPAPGIYNTTLYSMGSIQVELRSGLNGTTFGYGPIPVSSSVTPENLVTRMEFLPDGRYTGYGGMASSQPYLTELIFPPGEGIGAKGNTFGTILSFSSITQLPRCSFSSSPSVSYFMGSFCAHASSLTSVNTLASTNTNRWTDLRAAFYNCTALTSFPAINLTGLDGGINCYDAVWLNCSAMTSFGNCTLSGTTPIVQMNSTWANCSSLTSFPLMNFSRCQSFYFTWTSCSSLTSFPLIDTTGATNLPSTWQECTSLTSFPAIDTSNITIFSQTWNRCSSLTSFPLIDTSAGTYFGPTFGVGANGCWAHCTSLTTFPLLDFTSALDLSGAWEGCTGLTSFPLIVPTSCTVFANTWYGCSSLTSFPLIDTSSVTIFTNAWAFTALTAVPELDYSNATNFSGAFFSCTSLTTCAAGLFDGCACTDFTNTFHFCALTAASVNNILISIESNGTSNGTLRINQGTTAAPTGAGITAKNALIARGWVVITE